MTDETRLLLFNVAAFLKMLAEGYVVVPDATRREASELLDTIGEALSTEEPQDRTLQLVEDTLRTLMGAQAAEPYLKAIQKAIEKG